MNRDQKAATIDALASELQGAETIIAVDYRGLSVAAAAELRAKLREVDASFRVVKNSLTERAAEQAGVSGLTPLLEGPTALTFVRGDAALAAKRIAEQARATQLLPFKGAVMGAHALDPSQLTALARLPGREVLYGQLVGVIASPIGGLVRTLNALIGGLAVALGQVREQREQEEPAAAPGAVESHADEAAADENGAAAETGEEQETPAAPPEEADGVAETANEPQAHEAPRDGSQENEQDQNQAEAQGAQPDGADAEAS